MIDGALRLFLLSLMFLSGCVLKLPEVEMPSKIAIVEHDAVGRAIRSANLDGSSELYVRLQSLLRREKDGWFWTMASYAPGPYVFSGDGIEVHCSTKTVTVNFLHNGKWESYSKDVDDALTYLGLPDSFPLRMPE